MLKEKFGKFKFKYTLLLVALLFVGVFLYQNFSARSASYSFFQTDWSGGVSGDMAVHPGNATDWNKYTSADNIVATGTPGQVSLASTTGGWLQTETADFAGATLSGTVASLGRVTLNNKPDGATCASHVECAGGHCGGHNKCSACESFEYAGETYGVLLIGNQCWMARNLNVGTYRFSTHDFYYFTHTDVSNNGVIEKYCYNNNTSNCASFGGLYDWNEAMGYTTTPGAQGICAPGWHIPTDAEWYTVGDFLATGTNFGPRGRGWRQYHGWFTGFYFSTFWSSSISGDNAIYREREDSQAGVNRGVSHRFAGKSVRCVKD